MSRFPFADALDPELRVHITRYLEEASKPVPDRIILDECHAAMATVKGRRLAQATEHRPMHPTIVAILRPTSQHLRVAP